MLPVSQATWMSRMNEAREPQRLSRELRTYLRWEYGGDASYVCVRLAREDGFRSARKGVGLGRATLHAFAKLSETLVAAFATPGGA